MAVKVVTDSTSDLSPELAKELDITVVPVYLRFGKEVYRDGVDIQQDELYRRMMQEAIHPTTSQPTPNDFADVYRKLSRETNEIVSVHLSSKTSGTYNSALRGKEVAGTKCHIEVLDSFSVSMGVGLIAMTAARLAAAGENLQRVAEEVRRVIPCIHTMGLLDTLKYVLQGGRLGKAKVLLGTLLNVKPLLTMRDGEIQPIGMARTRSKGVESLFNFMKSRYNVEEIAIVHSTFPAEANSLKERISFLAKERIHLTKLGPALGVHAGPGTLLVALREKVSDIVQEAAEGVPLKKGFSLPSLRKHKFSCSCAQ